MIFDKPNSDKEIKKLENLNGVFYCGGDGSPEYLEFGRKVYSKAKSLNDAG